MHAMIAAILTLALALATLTFSPVRGDASYTASIYSLYPSVGGLNGGAALTLMGVNFMRPEGTTDSTQGTTVVYVGNEICAPIEYYNTDTMYVCTIPASPLTGTRTGTVSVQMVLIGTGYGTLAICADSSTQCKFSYSASYTPTLAAQSLGALALTPIAMDGYLMAGEVDQFDIRVDGTVCLIDYSLTNASAGASDDSWFGSAPLNNGGSRYVMQCMVQEQVAGRYNLSVTINGPVENSVNTYTYGQASPPRYAYRVDDGAQSLPYTFVQRPSIQSVSPRTGGVMGGGFVTITGTSFGNDCASITVTLGDAPAQLVSCSINQLVVSPTAQTDYNSRTVSNGALVLGQNGLLHELTQTWNGATTSTNTQPHGFNGTGTDAGYHRLSGIFVAPYSGYYSFLVTGNNYGSVWISSTSTSVNYNLPADASYNNGGNFMYLQRTQVSQPVFLNASDRLFISAVYSSAQFSLGVRIHNPNTAAVPVTPPPSGGGSTGGWSDGLSSSSGGYMSSSSGDSLSSSSGDSWMSSSSGEYLSSSSGDSELSSSSSIYVPSSSSGAAGPSSSSGSMFYDPESSSSSSTGDNSGPMLEWGTYFTFQEVFVDGYYTITYNLIMNTTFIGGDSETAANAAYYVLSVTGTRNMTYDVDSVISSVIVMPADGDNTDNLIFPYAAANAHYTGMGMIFVDSSETYYSIWNSGLYHEGGQSDASPTDNIGPAIMPYTSSGISNLATPHSNGITPSDLNTFNTISSMSSTGTFYTFLPDDNFYHQQHLSVPTIHQVTLTANSVREVQTIYVEGVSGGKVVLSTTSSLSNVFQLDTSASNWTTAINSIQPCATSGSVSVTKTYRVPSIPYYGLWINITYNCPALAIRDLLQLQNVQMQMTRPVNASTIDADWSSTLAQAPSRAMSGSFTLQYGNGVYLYDKNYNTNNNTTPALSTTVNYVSLQNALITLSGLDDVMVTRSGNSYDSAIFTIVYYSPNYNIPCLTIDSSLLRGDLNNVTCTVLQVGNYDRQYTVIPGDWLYRVGDQSQAIIAVNGIGAACVPSQSAASSQTDCAYTYDNNQTPTLINVAPTTASLTDGQGTAGLTAGVTLTVTGTGFTSDINDNVVQFLPLFATNYTAFPDCVTVSVNSAVITCTVPALTAGEYNVRVLVKSKGYNAPVTPNPSIIYALRIDRVYPLTGSLNGGQLMFVTGTGFSVTQRLSWITNDSFIEEAGYDSDADSVTIGGSKCLVELVSFSRIVCRTPPLTASGYNQSIIVTSPSASGSGNPVTYGQSFVYDASLTPYVTSVRPQSLSSAVTNYVTITGSGFSVNNNTAQQQDALEWLNPNNFTFTNHYTVYDNSLWTPFAVHFGQRSCNIQSVSDSVIVCLLVRAPPTDSHTIDNRVLPQVYVQGSGYAVVPSDQTIDITLQINSIHPKFGSLSGGQYLTISGSGFVDSSTTHIAISVMANLTLDSYPSMNYTGPRSTSQTVWQFLPLSVQCDIISLTYNQIVCFTQSTGLSSGNLTAIGVSSIVGEARVIINSIPSVCGTADESASCYYGWTVDSTPIIASSSPASGGYGSTLTVTGSGFTRHTLNRVLVGHDSCSILTHSDTVIVCAILGHTASTVPIKVLFSDVGFAQYATKTLTFQHLLYIEQIDVTQGSYAGGTYVTLRGNGFSTVLTDNVVKFVNSGNSNGSAIIVSATASQLTFVTPAAPIALSASAFSSRILLTVTGYYYVNYNYPNLNVWSAYPVLGDTNPPLVSVTSTGTTGNTRGQNPAGATPAIFQYQQTLTPRLTSVSPNSGGINVPITIIGAGFGASVDNSSVNIGNTACAVQTWIDTQIVCATGPVPGGKFAVDVYVSNKGLAYVASGAVSATTYTAAVTITNISPLTGGYGGGTLLTVTGTGFSSMFSANNLQICNTLCNIQSVSYNQLTCLTESLATIDRIRALGPTSQQELMGAVIGNMGVSMAAMMNAFDMDPQTTVTSTSAASGRCWIGMDMGSASAIVPTMIRWFAPYTKASTANGGQWQVSNDLSNWLTLATISQANEAWNYITLIDTTQPTVNVSSAYRYIRYYGPSSSTGACSMAEIQFIGYNVSSVSVSLPVSGGFSNTAACPLSFSVNAPDTMFRPQLYNGGSQQSITVQPTQSFIYDLTVTPLVTSISPNQGSSLGGTLVTITGSGFVSSSVTSVLFSSYPCTVISVTSTVIVCNTTARSTIGPSPNGRGILVTADKHNVGNAILAADTTLNTSPLVSVPILPYYRYIDRWSSLNTWVNNEPPMHNDTVIIPEGQVILMDITPPLIFVLMVQGVLIWDRQDGLSLDAYYIWINGGTFQIGTEQQPFMDHATITLHGDRYYTLELPHMGSKVLTVGGRGEMAASMGGYLPFGRYMSDTNPSISDSFDNMDGRGVLDIHGKPRKRVWTKVAESALSGSHTIVASEDVDFAPGETIILTASSGNMWDTEVLTVSSLGSDNRTITVVQALQHTHESYWYYAAGETVDLRVEVALISRNVKVQGDENSDYQQFGAHTMAIPGGIMRVENAEFTRCGQGFNLGRYCIHWHLAGDAHESYAKSNSIHRSYQRATTVHGTQLVTVFNEVAYDVKGHTFFVEDGAERENTWDQNLGVLTQPLYTMLSGDTKPATFWTSSPTNAWRSNVAAGSSHDGFWFELPGNPGGPSYTPTICPVHAALGQFWNNTSKNNGVHGLRLYPEVTPLTEPCNPNSAPLDTYFYNFTAFRNGGNGIFGKMNGNLHHINHKLLENGNGELSWVKYIDVVYTWNPAIVNLLAVGTIDPSRVSANNWRQSYGVWLAQNEYKYVDTIKFVNYGTRIALSGCNDCESAENYKQGGYTYRVKGLQYYNSTTKVGWASPAKEIFHDLDGSLTGIVNGTATAYFAFNEWPECVKQGAAYSNGIVCDSSVRVRRMQIDNVLPAELNWQTLSIIGLGAGSSNQSSNVAFRPKEIYGWTFPAVTSKQLKVSFLSPIDWTQAFVRYSEPEYVRDLAAPNGNEFSWTRFSFIDYRYSYSVLYPANHNWPQDTSVAALVPYVNTTATSNNLLTTSMMIGTGALTYNNVSNPQSGVYDLLINTLNTTSNVNQFINKYSVFVTANQCPPQGCPEPPAQGNFTDALYWSQASSWITITDNGLPPAVGDSVTIPSDVWMLIDVPLIQVDLLAIQGKLEFLDGMDHELIATRISVTGTFQAGNLPPLGQPFQSKVTVTLTGDRTSPTLIVVNNLFLGNKVMAVFGTLNFIGTPRAFVSTRLVSTVGVGDQTFDVMNPVDWHANDTISVSNTEYDQSQIESFNITAITYNSDKTRATIVVDRPFQYRHFAGDVNHGSQYLIKGTTSRLAAVVALTSRNIVVRGDRNTGTLGYGGSIVVSEVPGWSTPAVGKFNVSFVEFRDMGKINMSNPAILFQYCSLANPCTGVQGGTGYYQRTPITGTQQQVATKSINAVRGCSLTNTWNYGIVATGAQGVYLDNNIVHRAYRSAIKFDKYSLSAVITNNVMVGMYRSPSDLANWVHPIAGFFLDVIPLALTGNVATGSQDAGYTMRMSGCGSSSNIYGNEAHGNMIGLYALPDMTGNDCVNVYDWTLWKNSHLGLLTVDQMANMQLSNIVVSDNHIGVSLNFHRSGDSSNFVSLTQSVIMGSTQASTCQSSLLCQAVSTTDFLGTSTAVCGSVYGNEYRRIGLVTLAYMNAGKTCEIDDDGMQVCDPPNTPTRPQCGMPWEKRYGLPTSSFAVFNISQSTFAYWNATDCGLKSRAIAWNPTQVDHTPTMNFRRTQWSVADVDAKFIIANTPATENCDSTCDGRDQIGMRDEDGTLIGIDMGTSLLGNTLVSNNPSMVAPSGICTYQNSWNAYACRNTVYRRLIFESMDMDRGTRRIGPLVINRNADYGNQSYFAVGPMDDHCPIKMHFSWFPFLVQPGFYHDIVPTGTAPDYVRLTYHSNDASEKFLLSIFYTQPTQLNMFMGSQEVTMLDRHPTMSDPIGSWVLDPQARRAYVVMGGVAQGVQFNLIHTAYIQITMTLAVDYNTFNGPNVVYYLAQLLSIDPSRIKVAGVHSGSVVASYNVYDNTNTSTDATLQEASKMRLFNLSQAFVAAVQNTTQPDGSTYIAGYKVISLVVVPPNVNGTNTGSGVTIVSPTDSSSSGLSTGAIVGISVGSAVAALLILALAIICWRRQSQHQNFDAKAYSKNQQLSVFTTSPRKMLNDPAPSLDAMEMQKIEVRPKTPPALPMKRPSLPTLSKFTPSTELPLPKPPMPDTPPRLSNSTRDNSNIGGFSAIVPSNATPKAPLAQSAGRLTPLAPSVSGNGRLSPLIHNDGGNPFRSSTGIASLLKQRNSGVITPPPIATTPTPEVYYDGEAITGGTADYDQKEGTAAPPSSQPQSSPPVSLANMPGSPPSRPSTGSSSSSGNGGSRPTTPRLLARQPWQQ